MKKILILTLLLITSNDLFSQNEEIIIIDKMKNDVTFLASDKLKGRKTGSVGEKKAAKYISQMFEYYQLEEKGTNGYYQSFQRYVQRHKCLELSKVDMIYF